jgi:hypothetical protein
MDISVKMLVGIITGAIVSSVLAVLLLGPFLTMFQDIKPQEHGYEYNKMQGIQALEELQKREPPLIQARNVVTSVGTRLKLLECISRLQDADGRDLSTDVKIKGDGVLTDGTTFCVQQPGIYFITYAVTDSYGLMAEQTISILVNAPKKGG